MVPDGVPLDLAGLCFNCAEPGHVAGQCTNKTKCLKCKGDDHVARQCPTGFRRGSAAQAGGAASPRAGGARREPVQPLVAVEGALETGVGVRVPTHERLGVRVPASEEGRAADAEVEPSRPVAAACPAYVPPHARERQPARERLTWLADATPPSPPAQVAVRAAPTLSPSPLDTLIAGGASARPERERCIIYRTREVEDAERALRWSLVAYVSGPRRSVGGERARAALVARFPEL